MCLQYEFHGYLVFRDTGSIVSSFKVSFLDVFNDDVEGEEIVMYYSH